MWIRKICGCGGNTPGTEGAMPQLWKFFFLAKSEYCT